MNVYIPVCWRDIDLLKTLLKSMGQFVGFGKGHNLYVLKTHDFKISDRDWSLVQQHGFSITSELQDNLPQGQYITSNEAFKWMARLAEAAREPFLYLEPDCVFSDSDALDRLEGAWELSGAKMLGKLTATPHRGMHFNGVGVWGPSTWSWLKNDLAQIEGAIPFDYALRKIIVQDGFPTDLIQQFPPVVKITNPDFLDEKAVLHHGCKDDSAYKLVKKGFWDKLWEKSLISGMMSKL